MATQVATERVYNFSAGPAVMPLPVLQRIQDEILCLPGAGASVMEISHRSKQFIEIQSAAIAGLRRLLSISDDYEVLLVQGGARLQFSMIPMNLLRGQAGPAQYLITGTWGKSARDEAVKEGAVDVLWDGKATNYDRLPDATEYQIRPDAAYVHITSNETIQGVQFASEPETGSVPLVCDSSSDFLYRPLDINKYGLLYACAQKNAGPAGVTVVVIRKDLLGRGSGDLPGYLNFRSHAENESMWNTPPTFAIYVLGLIVNWLEETIGGLESMHSLNKRKAQRLYALLDQYPALYQGHAQANCRSLMNVTFRFPSEEIEKKFLKGAEAANLDGLKGHRSVGGIRASIYNAMPIEGVQALAEYMTDFAQRNA